MGDKVPIETYESIAKKCDRQEQEIERLSDLNKAKGALIKAQAKKIGSLLKGNEWLINQLAYISRKDGELIVEEMQHALKDKT